MQKRNYYLGLDIGTDSIGYAVTDEQYNLLKHRGEPMWGSHIFEAAKQAAERRSFRSARRRADRRKQRVALVGEIFAPEIFKKDERFFIRRQESGLYRCDVKQGDEYIAFNDINFTDVDFYQKYPTIHHLISELMESDEPHDVRLVYLACAYLVAHRGHFYSEISKDNVGEVLDFTKVYREFINIYQEHYGELPWECDAEAFRGILLQKVSVRNKEQLFLDLLNHGKKFKNGEDELISKEGMVRLLSGGTYELNKLLAGVELEEKISIGFRKSEEDFEAALAQAGDEAEIITSLRNLYDWATLADILHGEDYISKGKIAVYEQHEHDLKFLKRFIKKYLPQKYFEVFRSGKEAANYVAYSYNYHSVKEADKSIKKANKEEFCDYIRKMVKDITVSETDEALYEDMLFRLSMYTFMPKQTDGDNRVIPYQLYYYELKILLSHAKNYLPFLSELDEEGYTPIEKILSIMEFKIPYFVGPLRTDNGEHGWMERKAGKTGKIYPWNFEQMVDLDKSEEAFICRMTNTCSYIPNERVLPKDSLTYAKFTVLNEINNIKINGESIPVFHKQGIFGLFQKNRKVSVRMVKDYLEANNLLHKGDVLSGIDITIKSSLKSYHDFKRMLNSGILSEMQVEEIIARATYSEDRKRIVKWLKENYPQLEADDVKYISGLKYKDFGRLSEMFLNGVKGCSKSVGEEMTIMQALWETNDNLMQILSDQYTFTESIEEIRQEYYGTSQKKVESVLKDLYISNAVKRPIYRTLDIVKDVQRVCGSAPSRIFIEMARGGGEKGQRIKSRKEQIQDLYKNMSQEEVREISKQLTDKSDNELQSEVLFLYFLQLGRCAYTGQTIDIDQLKNNNIYNIDHIYPQAYVKDDSISNKVLVLSTANGEKSDHYPIRQEIRDKMTPYWRMLKNNNLISEEKFKRLTRNTPFTDEERMGFINRQLVETRQSTKAVATLLKMYYPDAEIIYSKAGLVSDFRKEFEMLKCRSVNDLHHAKDAYLNIVVGNVYYCRFTKNFFLDQKYTLKTRQLFTHEVRMGDSLIWRGEDDVAKVRAVMCKNNIHYTTYAFNRKGKLFDQKPLKAAAGLVPRKKGLDTLMYGGYSDVSATCFLLVQYKEKGKREVCIMPVELMAYHTVFASKEQAVQYTIATLETIWNKAGLITDVSFPLGLRPLKVNTMLEFDGFRACITGKANRGQKVGLTSMMPLVIGNRWEEYVKKIERFQEKREKNKNITLNERYDGISVEKNVELYDVLANKVTNGIYSVPFQVIVRVLEEGRDKFCTLSCEEQVKQLTDLVLVLKSGRAGSCNLSAIGGTSNTASYQLGSKLSNWKKKFSKVVLIDTSASGIYETISGNLLDFV